MNGPTVRNRCVVLGFLCTLSMITYLDRVCFGTVAPTLADELSLSSVAELKWAFTAFAIAYAVFEIPVGWIGDVWGPRRTLLRIVVCWSVCTALTGLVGLRIGSLTLGGLGTLVLLRFLFGAGEAGAYPNITRAIHNWFPADRAATVQGWIWMSGRLMGGLTPMVWTLLVAGTAWTRPLLGWRGAFALFGLLGLFWCATFALFFRDQPQQSSEAAPGDGNEAVDEQATIARDFSFPLGAFVRSRNLWLLCAMYFCMVYGWYFNITYLPAYLQDRFQLEPGALTAMYQGGPLWIGAIGCLLGGWLADWLVRRTGNRRFSRRLLGAVAEGLCAVGWLLAIVAPNVHCFVLAISLACLCNDLTLASAWATCQDIGQRHTAVTSACMNTFGTLGAAAAAWITGTIVEFSIASHVVGAPTSVVPLSALERQAARLAGYDYCFAIFAAVYFCSAGCWLLIDPSKTIVCEDQA